MAALLSQQESNGVCKLSHLEAKDISTASDTSKRDRARANNFRLEALDASSINSAARASGQPRPVANRTRNSAPLTQEQAAEARAYALSLGATDDMIEISDNMNTAYGNIFGREVLYIGTDVLPKTGASRSGMTANSRISLRGAIAHELIGHRRATLVERAFDRSTPVGVALDEAQASIRAARFAPSLTSTERYVLLRDGIARLRKQGLRIRDVRRQLWIDEP